MKKILLIGTALLFSSSALFAQSGNTMSGSDCRIGIKAGVNLSTIRYSGFDGATLLNDVTKQNAGYNFTVFGDFGVGNNFFIQPGISLQNKGTKLEGSFDLGNNTVTGTNQTNVMAIEVPINAVLRIPTGQAGALQISAGPYIGFNIDGKSTVTVTDGPGSELGKQENNLKFGSKSDDNLSSTDFGANFGLAYRLNNGFMFGGNYGLGLSNLVPKDNRDGNSSKAANRVIGFSVGYSF
ncbi:porin family protein [Pedobacter sp. UBA4863]|uniref:porin family protein n=1 Tax=Pedobacter sp. UBA4863 TaxID=1947060 RepID=UPI0025FD2651|nr:porin family protein [Pedobacter sp. UBA4863]